MRIGLNKAVHHLLLLVRDPWEHSYLSVSISYVVLRVQVVWIPRSYFVRDFAYEFELPDLETG